jgi:hypothetical protein
MNKAQVATISTTATPPFRRPKNKLLATYIQTRTGCCSGLCWVCRSLFTSAGVVAGVRGERAGL